MIGSAITMRRKPLPSQKRLSAATVFLSYAHVDLPRIEPIARAFDYWQWIVAWDQDNPNRGEDWGKIIEPRVAGSYTLLVAWSRASVKSKAVKAEIEWTLKRNTRLKFVPVKIQHDVTPPAGFWTEDDVDLSDWNGEPDDQSFEKLLDKIENPWALDNQMALIRDIKVLKTLKVVVGQKTSDRPSD